MQSVAQKIDQGNGTAGKLVNDPKLYESLADTAAEPGHLVGRAEDRATVRRAVADLPEPYREVVALRFFGDLSLAEVADATGRPLNTVKTHLRRGLERLRPTLEEVAPS